MAKFTKETAREGGKKSKRGKSEKTKAWELLGDFITDAGAEKAKKIMLKAPEEKFIQYYLMFLEYFKPKQQRTEITGDEGLLSINIGFEKDPDGKDKL